jgi:hypothetical protein
MFRNKFKLKPLKPMGISITDPLWKRVVPWLLYVASVTVIGVLMAVFLLEWMAGCGETYTDSKGVQHANECLFIDR